MTISVVGLCGSLGPANDSCTWSRFSFARTFIVDSQICLFSSRAGVDPLDRCFNLLALLTLLLVPLVRLCCLEVGMLISMFYKDISVYYTTSFRIDV